MFVFSLILVLSIKGVILWPNHDTSTLKLLQVIHRNGERTPTQFVPNDPFKNVSQYWPEGLSTLTNAGKYRMYKVGQLIHDDYKQFFGNVYSPHDIYVRSSASHRCIESVSSLLAGAFPPTKAWQWSDASDAPLAKLWQPFAIETFIPQAEDTLLTADAKCPNHDKEIQKITDSDAVKSFLKSKADFLANITKITGTKMSEVDSVLLLSDAIPIELERHLRWSDKSLWTAQYEKTAVDQLIQIGDFLWGAIYNNSLVNRVRGGPLVQRLVNNIKSVISKTEMKKSFIYSTHDDPLAAVMGGLGIFNNKIVPFDATLLVELHEKAGSQFVRIYYFNAADTKTAPHLMKMPKCGDATDCPIDKFYELTKAVIPADWNKECGL